MKREMSSFFINITVLALTFSISSCSSLKNIKNKVKLASGIEQKKSQKGNRPYLVRWAKNLDPLYESGNLPISVSGPGVKDGIVYIGSPSGHFQAYNLRNGDLIWRKKEKNGYHATPGFFKDQVLYGSAAGRAYSRHYLTGELNYAIDLGSSIETAPTIHKGRAIYQLRNHTIVVLDAATGKILWKFKRSVPSKTTLQRASQPIVANNLIYTGFADGYAAALSFDDGRVVWEKKLANGTKFIDVDIQPLIKDGKLFIGSQAGPLTVLDPTTGATLKKFSFSSSRRPWPFRDGLLVGTKKGKLVFIDKNLQVRKELLLSDFPITSISLWGERIVLGTTDGKIFFVDKNKFQRTEVFDLGSVGSSLVTNFEVAEGRLVAFSARNRLYVFINRFSGVF